MNNDEVDPVDDAIAHAISNSLPFSVIRSRKELTAVVSPKCSPTAWHLLHQCAGVYPKGDSKVLKHFRETHIKAAASADVYVHHRCNDQNVSRILLEMAGNTSVMRGSLKHCTYPRLESSAWVRALAGKRVLLISPFAMTMLKQYTTKELQLPVFKLGAFVAVQSIAGNHPHSNWIESLDIMKKRLREVDFDVALLSCGGYGFALCDFIKTELGKVAIYCGGGLQCWFGIRGYRWRHIHAANKEDSVGRKFNPALWVSPSDEEKPPNYKSVENGCYW